MHATFIAMLIYVVRITIFDKDYRTTRNLSKIKQFTSDVTGSKPVRFIVTVKNEKLSTLDTVDKFVRKKKMVGKPMNTSA